MNWVWQAAPRIGKGKSTTFDDPVAQLDDNQAIRVARDPDDAAYANAVGPNFKCAKDDKGARASRRRINWRFS
jgi:hypothetical protein